MPRPRSVPPRLAAVAAALATALAGVSCSEWYPEPVEGPVSLVVVDYERASRQAVLTVREVTTLRQLRTMEGDAVRLLGGAELAEDWDDILLKQPKTVAEVEAITYRKRPQPVDFSYFVSGGTVHPEDFHSLNMASIYFHFERAQAYFKNRGVELPSLPVLYFPTVIDVGARTGVPRRDNAYWDFLTRTFAILPFSPPDAPGLPAGWKPELPMGMNPGILAHEYAHAVFSHLVFPAEGVPWLYQRYFETPERYLAALNHSNAFNEGLADFFGAAISTDPAFIKASVSYADDARSLAPSKDRDPRCLTAEMRLDAEGAAGSRFDPYAIGSVYAEALWRASSYGNKADQVATGLLKAVKALKTRYEKLAADPSGIGLELHVELLAETAERDVHTPLCAALLDRFGLTDKTVPSCLGVQREKLCP